MKTLKEKQTESAGRTASDSIQRKSFTGIELKKDKPGSFTARIATLNVVDKDGDVTLPGAFPAGKAILISAYMHGSWSGALPVGKGVIREEKDEILVEGEFNLNTESGKEHYESIKFAPDLTEWSYGFIVVELDKDSEWNDNPKVWRVFKRLDVFEASPVLRGAGIDTATLAIKSEKDHGMTLADETEAALAAVSGVIARVKALGALRREEGKSAMSNSTAERMRLLSSGFDELKQSVQQMVYEPIPVEKRDPAPEDVRKAVIEAIKILNQKTEVSLC